MAPWLLSNARTPRYQKPVLQSYRLSSHLRETGRWPLRGEGEWRVGIRTCRQNPEAVSPRPWISRLRSFQIRWATGSPLLCRCPARNLGFTEPCDHWSRRCARAASGPAEQRDELATSQLIELHSVPASQGRIAGYRIGSGQSAGPWGEP